MGQSTILKAIHNCVVSWGFWVGPVNYGAKYNLESNSQLSSMRTKWSSPVNYGAKYNLESNSQPVGVAGLAFDTCELWGKVQS